MPLFEYHCAGCGAEFEALQSAAAASTVTCPRCGGSRLTRLLSTFAVGSSAGAPAPAEPGPCGACGAPRRGMCGEG